MSASGHKKKSSSVSSPRSPDMAAQQRFSPGSKQTTPRGGQARQGRKPAPPESGQGWQQRSQTRQTSQGSRRHGASQESISVSGSVQAAPANTATTAQNKVLPGNVEKRFNETVARQLNEIINQQIDKNHQKFSLSSKRYPVKAMTIPRESRTRTPNGKHYQLDIHVEKASDKEMVEKLLYRDVKQEVDELLSPTLEPIKFCVGSVTSDLQYDGVTAWWAPNPAHT